MLVTGKNVAKEVIKNNVKIKKVYLADNFSDKEFELSLKQANLEIKMTPKYELDKMTDENHQGIIMDIEEKKVMTLETFFNNKQNSDFVVILDHLEDPHNFGAIIRTCEAAGVDAIIIPKDRSVSINSTVMKTSAGALNNMDIVVVSNLVNAIEHLKKQGFWIFSSDMEKSCDYTDADYKVKTALVIGSEGFGVSRLIREKSDFIVQIPMFGKINSLNASVAAGILIYEVIKQRK